jgi:hypothetical protein
MPQEYALSKSAAPGEQIEDQGNDREYEQDVDPRA